MYIGRDLNQSFGFDLKEFEAWILIFLSLVFCIEHQHLIAWHAHPLVFRQLKNEWEQFVTTVAKVSGDLIARHSSGHVDLASDRCGGGACKNRLEGSVFGDVASDTASLSNANEHINIVIECNTASCGGQGVCGA